MAHLPTWPDYTEVEVQRTIERDFDNAEVASVMDALSSWDSPHLKMVILCNVRGRLDLIAQYEKWDWKDLLATTGDVELMAFRPRMPV